jgi:hypothetical protein
VTARKATPLKPPMGTMEDFARYQLIGKIAEVVYVAKKKTHTPIGHVTHEDLLRYGFVPVGKPLPYPVYLGESFPVWPEDTMHIMKIRPPEPL